MDQIPLIASYYPLLPPEERIPVTAFTFPLILLAPAPVFLLAYLSLRPNTLFVRLAILPFAVAPALYVLVGFRWMSWDLAPWNFALGLLCLLSVAKAVEFGTDTTGFPRLHKLVPNGISSTDKATPNGVASTEKDTVSRPAKLGPPQGLVAGLIDALDLSCSWRGIGWEHGKDTYVPPFPSPNLTGEELKRTWLKHAFKQFLLALFLLDALEVGVKQHPNFRHAGSASIWLPSLPPVQRWAVAVLMSYMTGSAVITGFQLCYHLLGLFAVLLLGHDPRSWPPIFEQPWRSTSLHDYWAKRWHQMFRRMFMIMGGYPVSWALRGLFGPMAGHVGLVVGTFVISGTYHTLSLFPTGIPLGWGSMIYFSMQGIGLGSERLFRHVTGRRVSGFGGWLWVMLWVVVAGMMGVDDWHMHGLGAGIIIPPVLSPLRAVIFPLGRMIQRHYWP
ncbi:hypothetical protein DACRYDRAFT_50404 [Dacryopinax primogenitus]|uniref:Wax synthase domain-containing protein n=1 Tax=Dacryopinax primogenitus (strain DJM 731) TaxID=1858805 RepID=M5FYK7_DACPD|nr:uncharacterized protein DACRYDRAFT_50404 [Dacryopinax primogenitus]EJU03126.1 hypothetical protein DACRYDRAFT_50404 [Dacryopinax primogenitus]